MDEQALRGLIAKVKGGKLSRRAFVHRMVALGLTAPMASQMLDYCGVAQAQADVPVQAHQARRRRRAQGAVVAGRDAAQSAFCRRHQGPGRLAHLLRAARGMGRGRQPVPGARRRDPEPPERRACRRRHVRHLEAEAGREVARRQAVHRRRRRVQLAVRLRSGDGCRHHRQLQGRQGREGRRLHRTRHLRQADAVLGGRLRRHARHDHPQAPVCGLHRRQVARRAGQSEARRHRPLPLRRLQAGRHGQGRAQPQLSRGQPAALRHASR